MFNLFKKGLQVTAPISGKVIDLAEVPDKVFASKLAGDGIAIDSTGDVIVAPADGKLSMIFRTNHAFGMILNNGIELLVHIGLDTVELNGEGFKRIADEGSTVKVGDPIIKIDRESILKTGRSLITPVLITNPDKAKDIIGNIGSVVEAGKDKVFEYKVR